MVDLKKYKRENLLNIPIDDIKALSKEDIALLAAEYFDIEPMLLIQKSGDSKSLPSPATWRSLNSLNKLNLHFSIVGLYNIVVKPAKKEEIIVEEVEKLEEVEFIAPEKPLIVEEKVILVEENETSTQTTLPLNINRRKRK